MVCVIIVDVSPLEFKFAKCMHVVDTQKNTILNLQFFFFPNLKKKTQKSKTKLYHFFLIKFGALYLKTTR